MPNFEKIIIPTGWHKRSWPTNPRTKAQQLNRQKFAVSILHWQLLDEKEKLSYYPNRSYPRYWAYHNFIRDFMLGN
jgi:hypothetical protein